MPYSPTSYKGEYKENQENKDLRLHLFKGIIPLCLKRYSILSPTLPMFL